ncbi:MAG: DHH family phosphoesterase, partial [bacterium]
MLINRGLDSVDGANTFLNPTRETLHNRSLPDSGAFVERVTRARDRGETVLVYGDYDVDGTTGTALLLRYLKSIGLNVLYFVPSREGRGYGIHPDILQEAKEKGVTLAITVDCGSEDVENAFAIQRMGIDLIITDHHPARQPNAGAFLTINPYINGYPFRYVSGAGVAYKLSAECRKSLGGSLDGLLALASFGTIADVMPLVDENRALARLGLQELVESVLPSLVALRRHVGLDKDK